MLPFMIVHADWGVDPKKRVGAMARLLPDGRYSVAASKRVGLSGSPRERLGVPGDASGTSLIGFDFPIGVPAAYAARANISSFRTTLGQFGKGHWRDFYRVCESSSEIGLHRPFYPFRPGGTKREHLERGLDIPGDELFRRCERKTTSRNAACPLFWTLGGNQVGKAAISGWSEFVQPIVGEGDQVGLWPFDGSLVDLLLTRSCVIAETYPAEFYGHLGLQLSGSKRSQDVRKQLGPSLLRAATEVGGELAEDAHQELVDGFGPSDDGEDRFDAMIGLLGMIRCVRTGSDMVEPTDPPITSVEGWMLGQEPVLVPARGIPSSAGSMLGTVPGPMLPDAPSHANRARLEPEGELLRKEITRLRGLISRAADDLKAAGREHEASRLLRALNDR